MDYETIKKYLMPWREIARLEGELDGAKKDYKTLVDLIEEGDGVVVMKDFTTMMNCTLPHAKTILIGHGARNVYISNVAMMGRRDEGAGIEVKGVVV